MTIPILEEKKPSTLGTLLLVTGSCIGAGMIGLPVVSALAGLIPTTLAMLIAYGFATGTGLLILESTLWFHRKVNLISMAEFALGKGGKAIVWSLFLFLFYCIFVAYTDGGGTLCAQGLSHLFGISVSKTIGVGVCVVSVGTLAYTGTASVSKITRVFLLALSISYVALVALGLPKVQGERLLFTNWGAILSPLPMLLICFGYQNLLPTLVHYTKKNVPLLKKAIFIGAGIPFLIYFVWNVVILGLLPNQDPSTLQQIISKSEMITTLLAQTSHSPFVLFFVALFSFFAIVTPFITNTLAFVDFFKDGFHIADHKKYDPYIFLLVLAPPTLCTLIYPDLFLQALGLAGGFADVILFGIIPCLIVWIGRYVKKAKGPYRAPLGKILLFALFFLSLSVLLLTRLGHS